MKLSDQERIINCHNYLKIEYAKGFIYINEELFFLRRKKIEKLFKGEEWHCHRIPYIEYFMHWVVIRYKQLKEKIKRYKEDGYEIEFLYPTGHEFIRKEED